jgi:antitoxin component of MazEF toxin-antitoxin module
MGKPQLLAYTIQMFDTHQTLHQHGGSIMVVIPAYVVKEFKLTKGQRLNMSYEDKKLVIDLPMASQTTLASKPASPGYVSAHAREASP